MGNRAEINSSELRKKVLKALKSRHEIKLTPKPTATPRRFPSDLTQLDDEQVRQHMSYWKAQAGYYNSLLASYEVDALDFGQKAKDFERRYKFANKPEKTTAMWEIESGLAEEPLYQRLSADLSNAKAMVMLLKTERDNAEGFFSACSRDLTARVAEGERESRGGVG